MTEFQTKRPKVVGDFIRQKREDLKLSQRGLGQLFSPPVTTQFISNVERGVTPLPPAHVATLARALSTSEAELMDLLEKEYAMKLSGRLGKEHDLASHGIPAGSTAPSVEVQFLKSISDAYFRADPKTRDAFATVCESILHVPKRPA
jgi:transcriptional regulator with XRE-family HTH domain